MEKYVSCSNSKQASYVLLLFTIATNQPGVICLSWVSPCLLYMVASFRHILEIPEAVTIEEKMLQKETLDSWYRLVLLLLLLILTETKVNAITACY